LERFSWRRIRPAATLSVTAPECFATPCRIGSRAFQRLELEEAWIPTNSPEQWSTAMKNPSLHVIRPAPVAPVFDERSLYAS
jgi:hypothetical protein